MTTTHSSIEEVLPALRLLTGDEKHLPSAHSTLEVIWALYSEVLSIGPDSLDNPNRDRFFLSKGHGPQAFYAVLATLGFFPMDWLSTFGALGSALGYHPDRNLIPGVEISSGSLGHGLPLAIGVHRAFEIRGQGEPQIFVLLGDAELDEGSNAEAIAVAGRLAMSQLRVIVINNNSSTLGWEDNIASRFGGEGWQTSVVDGRDVSALVGALTNKTTRPLAVIANIEVVVA